MGGEQFPGEEAGRGVHQARAACALQSLADGVLPAVGVAQLQHPLGCVAGRGLGRGDIGHALAIGLGVGDLRAFLQIEQGGQVIEPGVAPHARGDRQRLGLVLAAPQHHRVERPLMQIVEGGIGGEGSDHLGAAAAERIGQGQELRRRLADGQNLEAHATLFRQVQPTALVGEGLFAELELLFRDGGAKQGFKSEGHLDGIGRRGEGEVENLLPQAVGGGVPDRHHRQTAGRGGGLQALGDGDRLVAGALQIDDRRFHRQVAHGGQGGIGPTRRDGSPA